MGGDGAVGVGDDRAVDRLDPLRQGCFDIGDGANEEQVDRRVEGDLFGEQRGPDAHRERLVGAAEDDGTVRGGEELHGNGFGIPDEDRLGAHPGRHPPAARYLDQERAGLVARQSLEVQILIVTHGIRDAPGDVVALTEVRDSRDAGKREPGHVERFVRTCRGEVELLIDARQFEESMRVAGDDGRTGRTPLGRHTPGVAARHRIAEVHRRGGLLGRRRAGDREDLPQERLIGHRGHRGVGLPRLEVPEPQRIQTERAAGMQAEEFRGEPPEEHVMHDEHRDRRPRPPRQRTMRQRLEFRCGSRRLEVAEGAVHAVGVGGDQFPGAGGRCVEDAFRRHVELGAAGEGVPFDAAGPEDLGGASLGAQPHELDLPAPVLAACPALSVQSSARRRGEDVRDAVVITQDLHVVGCVGAGGGHLRHRSLGGAIGLTSR